MKTIRVATVLWLSLPLSLLVGFVSLAGLLAPEIYSKETPNWVAQASTQDAVDLFLIIPFLLVSALYTYQRNVTAFLVWGGIICYLAYTFLIYCFSVHFNALFVAYCLILGLSSFAFLYFLYTQIKTTTIKGFASEHPVQITWIYFMVIACFFYLLWLSEIIPAIMNGTIPKSLSDAGLLTNPVHVIDLSLFLPGVFIVALYIRRRGKTALQIAPAILIFFVFMDITIAVLMAVMYTYGDQINLLLITVMSALAVFSSGLLTWYLRSAIF